MEQNNFPISKQVSKYIERKPYILEALEQNIVNYSALARNISKDLSLKNTETIKAALIRKSIKYQKSKRKTQQKAILILREANFSLKNKIACLHHNTFVNIKAIAYSKTPSGYMFFLDENIAKKSTFRKIDYGYAILHIKSPKEIENTPGAIAYILSSLASDDINVSHVMGCREDTFIVIKEHDASLAFSVLSKRLKL
jgi:hypothetical protein